MKQLSREIINKIPKTDLHVHIDGSLRLSTLIELARERNIELPSFSEEGLNELVFKASYKNLDEYLKGFGWTVKVMQDEEGLERVAYELALDNFAEGVRYLEARFAPQLHMSGAMSFKDVMEAVDRGFQQAKTEINSGIDPAEPPFEYGIIVCAMRFFNEHFSSQYGEFFKLLNYSAQEDVIKLASLELAKGAVEIRRETDIQIVGFDLAGSEYGYPASAHEESYDFIHRNFLKKTVHAGEAYGPESIFQAITKLHADRIGHGFHLFNDKLILSPQIQNKQRYIRELVNFIADRRVTIEVCLTSNLQTSPKLKDIGKHSLGTMLKDNLSITFCTDNRLVSHTDVTSEIQLALDNFSITPKQLKNIIIYGFKRSFFYKPYPEKRAYVRRIIDYYEKIEKEFDIAVL
jgi:adenosine deaminase